MDQQLHQTRLGFKKRTPRAMQMALCASWEHVLADYLAHTKARLRSKTVTCYKAQLSTLVEWMNENHITLREFTAADMNRYLIYRADLCHVSDNTRRKDAMYTKAMLKYAKKEKLIPVNVLAEYKIPRETDPYVRCPDLEEVEQLLTSFARRWSVTTNPAIRSVDVDKRRFCRIRNVALVAGLVDMACRPCELLAIRIDDYRKGWVDIEDSKTRKPRSVPFSDEWRRLVDDWIKVRPVVDSDLLFVTLNGEGISVDGFSEIVRDQIRWAKITPFTLYGLRHYAITKLADTNLNDASWIAGHKSLLTTKRYLHTDKEHMQQTHQMAAPLASIMRTERAATKIRKRVI